MEIQFNLKEHDNKLHKYSMLDTL